MYLCLSVRCNFCDRRYWEVVELTRKLILSGLIGVVGRGTVAQAVAGTLIAFYFFAISYREQPFRSRGLNRIKIFSELQLFWCVRCTSTVLVLIACCLCL